MRARLVSPIVFVAALVICGAVSPQAQSPQWVSAYLGTLDLMPQLGKQTLPVAADVKEAAQLDAEIVVTVNGEVAHVRVLKSTDASGALEKACIGAMQSWRLKPAVGPAGQPMATLVRIRFEWAPGVEGRPGVMQAALQDVAVMLPPTWDATAALTVHMPKEPGMAWPRVVREIMPRYTQDAMRAKIQGTVEMDAVVLGDGTIGAARVTKGLGYGLDEAALAAARLWLFDPGKLNDQPVATKVVLQLEFRLH